MELTPEQRLARLESAFNIYPDGRIEIKAGANPAWSKAEVAAFDAELKAVAIGTGATTSPVTTPPAPVVTAPTLPLPTELLPTGIKAGFSLKGFEKKQYPLDLLKGRVYLFSIVISSVDGGGAHVQFVSPNDGSGFGYQKLKKGAQTLKLTAEKTGMFLFSIEANGGTVVVSAASLTLQDA